MSAYEAHPWVPAGPARPLLSCVPALLCTQHCMASMGSALSHETSLSLPSWVVSATVTPSWETLLRLHFRFLLVSHFFAPLIKKAHGMLFFVHCLPFSTAGQFSLSLRHWNCSCHPGVCSQCVSDHGQHCTQVTSPSSWITWLLARPPSHPRNPVPQDAACILLSLHASPR